MKAVVKTHRKKKVGTEDSLLLVRTCRFIMNFEGFCVPVARVPDPKAEMTMQSALAVLRRLHAPLYGLTYRIYFRRDNLR